MKTKKLTISISDIVTLVAIVSLLFFIPYLLMVALGDSWIGAFFDLKYVIPPLLIVLGGFLISYYVLVPQFLIKKRSSGKFVIFTIVTYLLLSWGSGQLGHYIYGPLAAKHDIPEFPLTLEAFFFLSTNLFNVLLIYTAMSIRFNQRNRTLELENAKQAKEQLQGELMRLKGQLNPHFLFNTLNNISSLSAFDPEATQESISRLSDMLRYVLYESSGEKVPLQKDVEFMRNYMSLMLIRYEDTLQLDADMRVSTPDRQIPPMLFISLLENAFKYGASSLHPCSLKVSLTDDDRELRFCVENTMLTPQEMASKKRGGLGLENLKKRLELIYPEHFTFNYGETQDNCYKAEIKILWN